MVQSEYMSLSHYVNFPKQNTDWDPIPLTLRPPLKNCSILLNLSLAFPCSTSPDSSPRIHAGTTHQTNPTYPIGSETVRDQDPQWNYNSLSVILVRDRFITCLLAGLSRAALQSANFEKLQEINQDKWENQSWYLELITKALLQYTNLDPENPKGKQILMTYSFS